MVLKCKHDAYALQFSLTSVYNIQYLINFSISVNTYAHNLFRRKNNKCNYKVTTQVYLCKYLSNMCTFRYKQIFKIHFNGPRVLHNGVCKHFASCAQHLWAKEHFSEPSATAFCETTSYSNPVTDPSTRLNLVFDVRSFRKSFKRVRQF